MEVAVAGRVMLVRGQGKIAFARLDDSSGSIQLFARDGVTEDLAGFAALSLADWIGARGRVLKTRKGELSVGVESWVQLAEARRSFGNKWEGITDTETRFRQREVDLWVNPQARGDVLASQPRRSRCCDRSWRTGDSSRSRHRYSIPSSVVRSPGPSSPITTLSTPISICGSRPSST